MNVHRYWLAAVSLAGDRRRVGDVERVVRRATLAQAADEQAVPVLVAEVDIDHPRRRIDVVVVPERRQGTVLVGQGTQPRGVRPDTGRAA